MNCKNCEFPLQQENKYCANCGAKIVTQRLTIKSLWSEFSHKFLNYDNTFFKTIKDLTFRPEVVIDGYINGIRKRHINVINFFAISLTILAFQLFLMKHFATPADNMFVGDEKSIEIQKKVSDILINYLGIYTTLMLPIGSIFTWLLFLDYRKYNFTEHIIINLYTTAYYTFISLPIFTFVLLIGLNTNVMMSVSYMVSIAYLAYVFKRLFNISFWISLLRVIAYYLLFIISVVIIAMVIAVIVILIMKLFF